MSVFYTEADYENSIIELFQGMGYQHVYGPDIERNFTNPLYETELLAALSRINPDMPADAISDALFKLKNFENAELVQKNAVFMDYLQHGIEVRYLVKGEERSGLVIITIHQKIPL
jgi:type I restriction enzyme R subunit